jgi:ribosomal protein S12 methylthiotransferase accessory factor
MAEPMGAIAVDDGDLARVTVVGPGLLAEAIRTGVRDADVDRSGRRMLVTVSDAWDTWAYDRVLAWCAARHSAWLPVHTELGRAVLGPCYTPGVPGCPTCAEQRRRLTDERFEIRRSVWERHPALADRPSPWLTALTVRTVAALAVDEVARWARPEERARRTDNALLYVDLDTLAVSSHRFLPDALCPDCGSLPADDADAARISVRPRPKPAPTTYRVRPLGEGDLARLRQTYVDERTGLIRRAYTFASGGLAVGAAEMRSRWQDRAEVSWGRTTSHQTSEIVAILESLERFGGMAPGGRRSTVRASYAEVAATAVDPRGLGLYPPERYGREGFSFQPFDVDRVCRWVWGYSFGRQEPVLVPQAYAYYRAHVTDRHDPSFAYEISNGCALGGCLEEAILYGILEVVERDAFLMTWYARLPAARVDLSSARDRSIPVQAAAIEAETGYRLAVFDTTMEHGIPSVWALATSPAGTDQPALACSAGAHIEPERAVGGALAEIGPILTDLRDRYAALAEHSRRLCEDAALVSTMDDHSTLYASREAASRLDFLTGGTTSRTLADMSHRAGGIDTSPRTDLTADLTDLLGRLGRHGLDVIVVDQTTPEHEAGGLHCVKVIVPGTLPMTFGHHNRRTHGLPRLYDVPKLLGYRDDRLRPEDVNPHPHPFP